MNIKGIVAIQEDHWLKAAMFSRRWHSIFNLAGAVSFAAVLFLSSIYCLLAYIPSTYYAFIQAPFLSWMPVFARLQHYLFIITFIGAALPLVDRFRKGIHRTLILEFWLLGVLAGVYLAWARPVQFLTNNSLSFVWAIAFLLPILCMGTLDYASYMAQLKNQPGESRSFSYRRVVLAALLVSVLYPATAHLRFYLAGMPSPLTKADGVAWGWAVITQLSLFFFVFSVVEFSSRMADRTANPALIRFALHTALFWSGLAICFMKIVLASVPLSGTDAAVYACFCSLAAVILVGGWRLGLLAHRDAPEVAIKQSPRLQARRFEAAGSLLFIIASALTVPPLIGALDWHAMLEKIWAITFWSIVAGLVVYRYPLRDGRRRAWPTAAAAVLSLVAFRAGLHSEKSWAAMLGDPHFDSGSALQNHAAFDASFAAADELMEPASARPCTGQCEFLSHQTNIPAAASVDLHEISLVQGFQPNTQSKPNIFVIVVDSLRRDYVSPYNSGVSFTPEIKAFADDSVVFRNAFTRYSGTTLSEPAIWAGTMQLHKHYVQPFHAVNNLEKLIQTDQYQSMVSVDTVLRVLLKPKPDLVRLDEKTETWTDLDFCSTATEIGDRISKRQDRSKPIFVYTQPQNIHIVTLGKTTALRPPRKQYAGFVDYYASELERLDGCFGTFIRNLKVNGLYENSIIVLTADHGEALEKMGTERHAFSLKPEVIRIPLIVHVPRAIKESWYHDPDLIAFNTDITATLYELLDHGPVVARREFGRPLFTRTNSGMQKYRQDSYMIASSYGLLYGLLYDNGKRLFTESQSGDEFYDLERDPAATRNILTEKTRLDSETILQGDIQRIADLYGYKYTPPTILGWLMR